MLLMFKWYHPKTFRTQKMLGKGIKTKIIFSLRFCDNGINISKWHHILARRHILSKKQRHQSNKPILYKTKKVLKVVNVKHKCRAALNGS